MDIFDKYSELKREFEALSQIRRDEILNHILETDDEYKKLLHERINASMAVKDMLYETEATSLFEKYSDAIYAQEIYELDVVYKQAFIDAVMVLQKHGFL